MKKIKVSFEMLFGLGILVTGAKAQNCVDLLNLTFDSSNAGDIALHPDVSNISPWVNGSEIPVDPFGASYMPDDDFGNGYAGLTVPSPNFGYKWGFEGSFDVNTASPWDVCEISFDYAVLGHNGEAALLFALGTLNINAPLPSTDGGDFGPVFSPVAVAEAAAGSVTINFLNDTITVSRSGYADHTVGFTDSLSLSSGTYGIDFLVSNTRALSDGGWDANADSTGGADAYYRIDNFRMSATQVPEPSAFLLLSLMSGALLLRRRK